MKSEFVCNMGEVAKRFLGSIKEETIHNREMINAWRGVATTHNVHALYNTAEHFYDWV